MRLFEDNPTARNTLLGALFGGGLALAIFGLWYYAAASLELPEPRPAEGESQAPASDELHILFVIVPTLVGAMSGAALGRLACVFVSSRYLKLLGSALALYFAAALVCAGALVAATTLSEAAADPQNGAFSILTQTLQGGLFGALILSPLCVPLILLLVFVLERLTRPSADAQARNHRRPDQAAD